MKEIVFIGSGTRHLDFGTVSKYASDDYITIGPVYNQVNCMVHDYYLWSANGFKVWVMMQNKFVEPPKKKTILVNFVSTTQKKITENYKDEFDRLKGEFYTLKPWKDKVEKHSSLGFMTFFYLLEEYKDLENIIFLGCSALAGDCDDRRDKAHDFSIESMVVKKELKERNITSKWIHQKGVY